MKKIFLFALSVFVFEQSVFAYDFSYTYEGQTLYYNIVDGEAWVTYKSSSGARYDNLEGSLTIPYSVIYNGRAYTVRHIGPYAFEGCSGITSVTIPIQVRSIGNYAFYDCTGIISVYYVGDVADWCNITFYTPTSNPLCYAHNLYFNCNHVNSHTVTDLIIPNTVDTICNYAFYKYTSLTSVTFPSSVTTIGSDAFSGCTGLTSVNIGNSVTSIGNYAFDGCTGLTSLTIGTSVTTIGSNAFRGCTGLCSISVPNSVTSIGSNAFNGIKTVTYDGSATGRPWGANSVNNVFYWDGDFIYQDSSKTYLAGCCFCPDGDLIIPSTVVTIGNSAFYGCTGLTSVTIPTSVSSIGNYAFYGCTGLTDTLTIPNSVSSIGDYAFYGCTGLTGTLTIPNSVSSIGDYAFYGCTGLTDTLTIPNSVRSIGSYAFRRCTGLTSVSIPTTFLSMAIGEYAFAGCTGLTGTLTIPNSVSSINRYVFSGCTGLTSVTLPSTVSSILDGAFAGCTGLTGTLTIPNSVSSIYERAFSGCTGITSLTISNYFSSIGNYAFSGCTGLTSLTLSSPIGSIGENAFYGCTGLTSLTIAARSIGKNAFKNCTSLTTVNFNATNCNSMGSSSQPAFSGCTSLATLNIGDNVQTIPAYAFNGCSSITEIYSHNNVAPTLGSYPFTGVVRTIPVHIPCGASESYSSLWSYFSNFIESDTISFSAVSSDDQMGTVQILTVPSCSNHQAVIYANSNTGYQFHHWSDGSTDNPHTLLATIGMTIIAYFGPSATVTVTSNNTTMGSASGSGSYVAGYSATIRANANYGYHFTQWNDGNTDNPRIIDVTGDTSFTAYFEINHYTVNVASNNTVYGNAIGGGTFDHGTTITISAVATTDHHFIRWQDRNTDNPRTITVTSNATYTAYFAIDEYTITTISDNPTMGTVSGSGSYAVGSTAIISAESNYGYHFKQWNDGNTDNPRTLTVTGDATYTAYFEPNQYTITVVSDNTAQGSVSGGGTFDYGTSITISAEAITDHHFIQWQDGNTQNQRTVNVTSDITYTAYFAIDEYTLTVVPNSTSSGNVAGGGTYSVGTTVTISAEANYGYHFTQWQDGNADNPRIVTVRGDTTYTAYFEINRYTVTVVSGNTEMGSVTGGGTFIHDTTITISAEAVADYHFTQWNDGNTQNPRTLTVTGDATYTAYFAIDEYILTVVSINSAKGTVTGGGTYAVGTAATISAEANYGYHFSEWQDGNNDNPRTVIITGNATYTAYFEPNNYIITVLSDNPTMGTVSGGGTYAYGSTISISAQPAEGCWFAYWQDGNNDNPRYITVTDNAQYVAHFYRPEDIDDVETTDNIKIYTRGNRIVIDFSGQQAADGRQSVVVYDVMGRVIKQSADSGQQTAIEIPVTTTGVYMVKVGERPTRKVVVRP